MHCIHVFVLFQLQLCQFQLVDFIFSRLIISALCFFVSVSGGDCWHVKPRWYAYWRFDEDLIKLFWTILKPLPLEWSLHWWRKGDLIVFMLIKAGTCALYIVTSF